MDNEFFLNFVQDFAQFVYKWNETIILIIGTAVSVLFWCFVPKKEKWKVQVIIACGVLILTCTLSAYIQHVKETYGFLPQIHIEHYSFQDASERIISAGFENCSIEFDEVAQTKIKDGEEPYSYYFKVVEMSPEPGSFQRLDTKITMKVTWKSEYKNSSLGVIVKDETEKEEIEKKEIEKDIGVDHTVWGFDPKEFYGNVDERSLYLVNANEITIYVNEKVVQMSTNGIENVSLGYCDPDAAIPVEVVLVRYDTGEVIGPKKANMGDKVVFSELEKGVYYYIVRAEGYEMSVPNVPFRIDCDMVEDGSVLALGATLEKKGSKYSPVFKVQLQDAHGVAIKNTEAMLCAVSRDKSYPVSSSYISVTSDENGYLTLWQGIGDMDYFDIIDFTICKDFILQVCIEGDEEYIDVNVNKGIGVCTIPD